MIIGIAGSFGAGKGTVVEYLKEHQGFKHFSASGFITEEITRRGLAVDRDNMAIVANDLRHNHSPTYIIDSLFTKAEAEGGDVIIESLRAVAEVERIKELGGIVLAVDAEPEVRYERSVGRGSEKDNVSYEKWLEQERLESDNDDPFKQNIFGAMKLADYTLENNGSVEELHAKIEEVLQDLAT